MWHAGARCGTIFIGWKNRVVWIIGFNIICRDEWGDFTMQKNCLVWTDTKAPPRHSYFLTSIFTSCHLRAYLHHIHWLKILALCVTPSRSAQLWAPPPFVSHVVYMDKSVNQRTDGDAMERVQTTPNDCELIFSITLHTVLFLNPILILIPYFTACEYC